MDCDGLIKSTKTGFNYNLYFWGELLLANIMKKVIYIVLTIGSLYYSCKPETKVITPDRAKVIDSIKIYTHPSEFVNEYLNFNSPDAINTIAEIENEYFNHYYNLESSKYYGTEWYNLVGLSRSSPDSMTVFEQYALEKKGVKLDSMHCTIFAVKALEAGFGKEFETIKQHHDRIWPGREYAGWSLGYILTKFYNWQAYLFISKQSEEYERCLSNYNKDQSYHVWKQPNIPIEKIFDVDEDKEEIRRLLKTHEFGWGFSDQGWHIWITRFEDLKECNWLGAPAMMYNITNSKPLFLKTKFVDYYDYDSHIIIFPPKKQ